MWYTWTLSPFQEWVKQKNVYCFLFVRTINEQIHDRKCRMENPTQWAVLQVCWNRPYYFTCYFRRCTSEDNYIWQITPHVLIITSGYRSIQEALVKLHVCICCMCTFDSWWVAVHFPIVNGKQHLRRGFE